MLQKILNHTTAALTVTLVVLFCTSGLWNGYQSGKLENYGPGNPPEETAAPASEEQPSPTPTLPPAEELPATEPTAAEPTAEEPAEVTEPEFTVAPEGYFKDALFVGDSRTLGLWEYGNLEDATFFATTGMSVYSVYYEEVSNRTLETVLNSRPFKKVYVMLGINELGYDMDTTVWEYEKLIQWIREAQPEAIIYIQANLHVSARRSGTDPIFNNGNIDLFNARIAELADGKQVFYLDVNTQFDDGEGNLADQYTADDTHVLGKYYRRWSSWIMDNAIVI